MPAPSVIAVLGGDAAATGTNTVATGEVTNKLATLGGVTLASGEAQFSAEGTGPGAQASAHSGVYATGVDVLRELTINQLGGSGTDAWASSSTKYFAVDLPGWTPSGGPMVVDHVINLPYGPGGSGLPSGNAAHNTVTATAATAEAPVALAAESHTLVVGDHLSAVSGWALVAA